MSANKYALGTIIGTALVGLVKSKIGSHIKLKEFHFFKPISLSHLPVMLKDPSKLADPVVKIDCQGNEDFIKLINSLDFSRLPAGTQQNMIIQNEEHHYCRKNENGECVLFLTNQNEIKKVAEKILELIIKLNEERISVKRISDAQIELENFDYHEKIKTYKRLKQKVLIIRKPYNKWHEYNLKNICELITPQIHKIGYFNMQMHIPFEGTIRLSHHPNTDAGKKELSDEIYKIIDERFGEFGLKSNRNMRPFDFNLNFNRLTKSHLMIKEDGEWIPYKKPESTPPKLRKR